LQGEIVRQKTILVILLVILLLFVKTNLKAAAPVEEESSGSILTGLLTLFGLFSPEFIKNQRYDIETGLMMTGKNDVRVPGNSGTNFSLTEDFDAKAALHFRFKLVQPLAEKHRLIFTYAPLKVTSTGTTKDDIHFGGSHFIPNLNLTGEYRLDSYRQSYMLDLVKLAKTSVSVGASVEIRDEAVKLSGSDYYGKRADTNVVFLANAGWKSQLSSKTSLLIEGDFLIDKDNSCNDIYLGMYNKFLKDSGFKYGYRIIQRKTYTESIHNNAVFHFLTVGVDLNL
jgi:hypothetical protein